MSFELVRQLQEKAAAVEQVCRLLEVSRSGYYAARRSSKVVPAVRAASAQLKAAFAASGGAYGSRRLCTAVASRGVLIGICRLRRLVRQHGVRSAWKRKFIHTTDSKHASPISPNVPDRQLNPTQPIQAWVADMPYIRTRSGWLYLAVVLDLFARKVVGRTTAPDMQAQQLARHHCLNARHRLCAKGSEHPGDTKLALGRSSLTGRQEYLGFRHIAIDATESPRQQDLWKRSGAKDAKQQQPAPSIKPPKLHCESGHHRRLLVSTNCGCG